jgi:hypothetical protein
MCTLLYLHVIIQCSRARAMRCRNRRQAGVMTFIALPDRKYAAEP